MNQCISSLQNANLKLSNQDSAEWRRSKKSKNYIVFKTEIDLFKVLNFSGLVLEDNVKALPMLAYVFYAKNGYKCGDYRAFTMLRKGLVRVKTSYDDWRRSKKSKNLLVFETETVLFKEVLLFRNKRVMD